MKHPLPLARLLVITTLLAQAAPVNDDFVSRRAIPVGIPDFGSTRGATVEPGEPDHGLGSDVASLWWTWTAPVRGEWLLLGTDSRTGEIYTGSQLNRLVPVSSTEVTLADERTALRFEATLRTAYQFALSTPVAQPYDFKIEISQAPANDRWVSAILLTGSNFVVSATNSLATVEAGEPPPSVRGSLWWRWFASQNGLLQIEPKGRLDIFRLRPGIPFGLTPLELVPPTFTNRFVVVEKGNNYFLRAASPLSQYAGNVSFNLNLLPQEPLKGDWFPVGTQPASPSIHRWFTQSAVVHEGNDAAQSRGASSEVGFQVTGPGTLSFWWKVSSNRTNGYLRFQSSHRDITLFNSHPVARAAVAPTALGSPVSLSGEVDWHQLEFRLGAGTHGLRWSYSSVPATRKGADAGWLDQIQFHPDPILPFKLSFNSTQVGTRQLLGSFADSRLFVLQESSDLQTWFGVQSFVSQPGKQVLAEAREEARPIFYRLVTP